MISLCFDQIIHVQKRPLLLKVLMKNVARHFVSKDNQWRRFIINAHVSLRKKVQEIGDEYAEKIWQSHVSNTTFLKDYSWHMHQLAIFSWDKCNIMKSRISWTYDRIKFYFCKGGVEQHFREELRRILYHPEFQNHFDQRVNNYDPGFSGVRLTVLDVGSCYNPFSVYEELDVTAIDISPAVNTVKQCDFLTLQIQPNNQRLGMRYASRKSETSNDLNGTVNFSSHYPKGNNRNSQSMNSLPAESFNCVVFCQFIGYIPSPRLRYLCCQKAYDLLIVNGILIIITPVSSFSFANGHMADLWKITLEHIGFHRIKYRKWKYFHSMVFRKAFCKELFSSEAERELSELEENSSIDSKVQKMFSHFDYGSVLSNFYIHQDLIPLMGSS